MPVRGALKSTCECEACKDIRRKREEYRRIMMALNISRDIFDLKLEFEGQMTMSKVESLANKCMYCLGEGVIREYTKIHTRILLLECNDS